MAALKGFKALRRVLDDGGEHLGTVLGAVRGTTAAGRRRGRRASSWVMRGIALEGEGGRRPGNSKWMERHVMPGDRYWSSQRKLILAKT
jgi:hypothetical protein